ncbi:cysteine-rich receptor-like protein kinase 3 [Prosopis cineraria]|uniref:cysteine-rich receptor-like protein kinase 3 n=1 Tax=Prosopis cineraria TaxID=364024 RepID=UPI00240F9FC3|nr:cysteine-rich receptor-like protein kinase 3 [Prosopis cineraria]
MFNTKQEKQKALFPSPMYGAPLLLLLLLCFAVPSLSDPRATEAALMCTNRTTPFSDRNIFTDNFLAALDALTPSIAWQRHASVINGTGNSTVHAFAQCMKDLSEWDCNVCFAQIKSQVPRCLAFQRGTRGGRVFFDGCYLRYDDYDFFNESLSDQDRTVCGNKEFGGNQSVYEANAMELVRNLSVEAPNSDGFFVGFVRRSNVTVYGLAQCWEFVNGSACERCLAEAVNNISSCTPKEEGRVLNAGCYLRYSNQKFYDNSTNPITGNQGNSSSSTIMLAASSAGSAFVLVVAVIAFFARKKMQRRRRERRQFGALLDRVYKSKLNMTYEVLERATNYFNTSNKLGQGGSGSVYKGVLPDGNIVAIKRLSFHTAQWADHFFNEVNLISGIQHKNLVRLLGCSITGPESLLVYEYVPNQSVHDHFSVKQKSQPLTWEARRKIILGTAEGLAYLHEESPVRIIHRDIKLSNILLEKDFTPKIADFGLARLFPEDGTHISTTVAGTLGYMAPEYVVQGKLTEKADIYSFGVLLIEIISGKRSSSFVLNASSILQVVWNLHRSGNLCNMVDPRLEGNYPFEEACRLLQIGLLCAQASANLRPSMSEVVRLITSNEEIPQPTKPPFLVPSSVECSKDYNLLASSDTHSSEDSMTESLIPPR